MVVGKRPPKLIGTIIKIEPSSIWDDKRFVLTIAATCTATFVVAMIVATAICCVYHRRFFKTESPTKAPVQEVHRSRHPSTLG